MSNNRSFQWLGESTHRAGHVGASALGVPMAVSVGSGFELDPLTIALWVLAVVVLGLYAVAKLGGNRKGFASGADVKAEMSKKSARGLLGKTRPSLLEDMTRRERRKLPATEYAVPVGRCVSPRWRTIWGTPEDTYLILGPSGASKSTWMDNVVADAPGAVIHTSSKAQDRKATWDLRARKGPVYLFDPDNVTGTAGADDILNFSPVDGCKNPKIAMRHGGWLLFGARGRGNTSSVNEFFSSQANEVLRCYLHAAALGGKDMRDVARWANNPRDTEPLEIMRAKGADPDWIALLASRQQVVDNTRDGIFQTLATALEWMSDPDIARAVTPDPNRPKFNPKRFILDKGTLYLVGKNPTMGAGVAPLFTMLTCYLVESAEELANEMATMHADLNPGTYAGSRRLDPWLTLALDEVATICPIPLDDWLSKLRDFGVTMAFAVQSRSQLAQRWGRDAASTIWNNAAFTLVLRGLKDTSDLEDISVLCGDYEKVTKRSSTDSSGRTTTSTDTKTVRTMTPSQVRKLGRRQILVIYRGSPPVIVTATRLWLRADVRRIRRDARKGKVTTPPVLPTQRTGTYDAPAPSPFADPTERNAP